MENVTLDHTTVLQLDADGTDRALDAPADRDVLRNDAALDLYDIVDQKIRGAQLAFDSAEDLRWTIAFDIADDRHSGADARACSPISPSAPALEGAQRLSVAVARLSPRLLPNLPPCSDPSPVLEHVHLRFPRHSLRKGQSCLLAIARELTQSLLLPRGEDSQVRTPFENRTAQTRTATTMEPTSASHSVYGAVSGISLPNDSRIAPPLELACAISLSATVLCRNIGTIVEHGDASF